MSNRRERSVRYGVRERERLRQKERQADRPKQRLTLTERQ